jgi:hypothetical protein
MAADITDQFIPFKEIQAISSTSCQSVIGQLRSGVKISSHQLCKPDIIKATWQMAAGLQLVQVYFIWHAWMVSLMFGTSSTDKTK